MGRSYGGRYWEQRYLLPTERNRTFDWYAEWTDIGREWKSLANLVPPRLPSTNAGKVLVREACSERH